jgi:hypothetical protein
MASDARKLYYVYKDDTTGEIYFYDTQTGGTTFTKPSQALLIDPETQKPYKFEPAPDLATASPSPLVQRSHRRHHHAHFQEPMVALGDEVLPQPARLMPEVTPEVRRRQSQLARPASHGILRAPLALFRRPERLPSNGDEEFPQPVALLPGFMSEISRFQSEEYARRYFREHRPSNVFKRRFVELSPGVKFQADPIRMPVLLSNKRSEAKLSISAFRLILKWTGADPAHRKGLCSHSTCRELLKILKDAPELRDEIFCQLVKQTRKCPDPACLSNTWDLFLIVATIFPSSRNSEAFIKSHLAGCAKSGEPRIADFAQFTFIRFSSRCAIGYPLDPVTNDMLRRIPHDPYMNHASFEASIYEQLWTQRTAYPRLAVPHLLFLLSELVLKKGGSTSQGLFRLSGNASVVKEAISAVNRGADPVVTFDQLSLNDCASLFKAWFTSLPERIISIDNFRELKAIYDTTKNYKTCFDDLLPAQIAVLKFTVGFVRKLATYEAVTRMGLSNFRIIFSSIIVSVPKLDDTTAALAHTTISQEFVGWLLENLDPTGVYPVPPGVLSGHSD